MIKNLGFISGRYHIIDKIGAGAMGEIYRAYDRLEKKQVALKRVKIATDSFTGDTSINQNYLNSITHEFQLLSGLRHPNIISVLDYGIDQTRTPYYVMELLSEAVPLLQDIPTDISQSLAYLMDILQALEYLHRRGIIHRDLKPSNILINEAYQVKVLDFGLAMLKQTSQTATNEMIIGTLAYISPEQISHQYADERSDLYAIGVIAYQMLVAKHPFNTNNVNQLIHDIVHTPPDLTPIIETYPHLATLVGQLLEKKPQDRFASAYEVMQALAKATQISLPAESLAVRESFLHASQLIGRDDELSLLNELMIASQAGKGQLALIVGDGGVGKSRLLNEMRIRGLIRTHSVLIGQAKNDLTGRQHPYMLWQNPLRQMLLASNFREVSILSILKEILPDIEQLVDEPIPDAPELVGRANLDRLRDAIVTLIKHHCQTYPTLLIIEDAHEATPALAIIHQLLPSLPELSLLILVSLYPVDGLVRAFSESYPQTTVVNLHPLKEADIGRLIETVIGQSGKRPEVADMLQKETEGNIFFVIEILKALAENAGSLQNIGLVTLPPSLFTGGIQRLLEHRLARIPEAMRPVLEQLALVGRVIDLNLLKALSGLDDATLQHWLGICADVHILGVTDDQWIFTHEKLRQAIIKQIALSTKKAYHRHIGTVLEQLTATPNQIARALISHFIAAEDIQGIQRYLYPAMQQAQQICDYEEVLRLSEWADTFTPTLLKLIGDAHEGLGDYVSAHHAYETMLNHPQATIQDKIAALNGLSILSWRVNLYDQSEPHAQEALRLARLHNDRRGEATALNNLGICASDTYNFDRAQGYYEAGLAIRQEIGDLQGEGYILSSLGIATLDQAHYAQARDYFVQARQIAERIGDRHEMVFAMHGLSTALCQLGEYKEALDEAQKGLVIAKELHNLRDIALCTWRYATAYGYLHGRIVMDDMGFDVAIEISRQIGDIRLLGNILMDKARLLAHLGDMAEHDQVMRQRESLLNKK